MRRHVFALLLAVSLVWCITGTVAAKEDTHPAGAKTAAVDAPLAVLSDAKFEFEPVVDGTQIAHDFPIANKGDGPLAITKVKTG